MLTKNGNITKKCEYKGAEPEHFKIDEVQTNIRK